MIIRYLSDLHLEFGNLREEPKPADVLILAGDITIKNRVEWVNIQANRFNHVIMIMGNHEFYRQNLDNTFRKTQENLDPKVHLLQNESVTIDGVTFHGTTLWTDMNNGDPMTYLEANGGMNDFRLVRADNGTSRFSAERSHKEHNVARVFLNESIQEGDVVITHHAPTMLSIADEFRGQRLNGAYASDLSDIMFDRKPALWFHGHVHNTFDYMIGDTRVLCNPRGYEGHELNPDFNVNAEVEI